jgi:hypothetical protein
MKYSLQEVYDGIQSVNDDIESGRLWQSAPTALSEQLMRLSSYKNYLGGYLADVTVTYRNQQRKLYMDLRAGGQTPNAAKTEVDFQTKDLKGQKEVLEINYKTVRDHCEAIRTHISALKNEYKSEIPTNNFTQRK